MDDNGLPMLGKASVFVSHAWRAPFGASLAVMLEVWKLLMSQYQEGAVARPFNTRLALVYLFFI